MSAHTRTHTHTESRRDKLKSQKIKTIANLEGEVSAKSRSPQGEICQLLVITGPTEATGSDQRPQNEVGLLKG